MSHIRSRKGLWLMLSGILFFYCLALAVVLAIIFNTRKENQK